ncbi:endoglucanase 1-like [Chenopodium quinoa]|uniref:endoglucanase 1-like n=1 Tax=Chenopodium quinoa TaxID=63459 RepID=UPI000B774F0F|nr:endoglucanase 1-like [Chenopodium quinoa]
MVIQLVGGLTKAYSCVGALIRQSNPLPAFYQARSILTLEEAGMAKNASTGSDSAMVAASSDNSQFDFASHGQSKGKNQKKEENSGNCKNSGGGSGRDSDGGKSGQGSGGGSSGVPRGSGGQQPSS